MFFVDSHCHLNFPAFQEKQSDIIKRAENVDVMRFLTVSTRLDEIPALIGLTRQFDNVFACAGIHPEYASEYLEDDTVFEKLCSWAKHPKIIAIGETGLDYHYGTNESREGQRKIFELHLKAAKYTKLPVIIHSREAEDDTIALLEKEADKNLCGVLHCFSSQKKLAQAGLELGFYISASGIITFKSADELRDIFTSVPVERLLLETDSPYLAPVPYRGKTNEPSFIFKTAEVLAGLKQMTLDQMKKQTTQNFFTLFSKAF